MRGNPALKEIVGKVADLLQVPIAAISVIDRDRQWFPVITGLGTDETPRDISFCAHAINTPSETFCIPDASRDDRFRANPLVTGEPGILFYAGAPLVTREGASLGALCAIDTRPRPPLTDEQEATLKQLAERAVDEIQSVEHLRRFGADAIELILDQIREAAREGDETLLLALDKVLQSVERRLAPSNAAA